jgi:rhodanese-related sulfurtransferase
MAAGSKAPFKLAFASGWIMMNFWQKLFGRPANNEKTDRPASTSATQPEPVSINEISPQSLKTRLDQGDHVLVIDIRQAWEYQAGHIPGAKHIFVQDIPRRLNELSPEVDLVFQCWHGHTSLDVSAFVIEQGWSAARVASLSGGMAGWVQAHGAASLVKD